MTVSLSSHPRIAALLVRVTDRLEAEFPTVPAATILRCVEAARAAARTSTSDPLHYADMVESLARTDLVTLRLVAALGGDGA